MRGPTSARLRANEQLLSKVRARRVSREAAIRDADRKFYAALAVLRLLAER